MISVKKTHPLTLDTFRDDSIKVNISTIADVDTVGNGNFEASNQNGIHAKCVRCDHLLDESESLFITVHPAIRNPEFSLSTDCLGNIKEAYSFTNETPNSYNGLKHFKSKYMCTEPTSEEIQQVKIGTCDKYELNRSHCPAVGNSAYNFNGTFDLGNGSLGFASETCCDNHEPSKSICMQTKLINLEEQNTTKTFDKCKLKRTSPESLQVIAVKNFSDSNDCDCDSTVSSPKSEPGVNLCSSTPCADCHIALVFNYPEGPSDQKLSLMLQVSQKPVAVQKDDKETQTESLSEVNQSEYLIDIGDTESNIPSTLYTYQEHTLVSDQGEGKLPGKSGYKDPLPELSRANEAAYQAHLNSLVPCSFCGRRFTADRVMVHEGACIERPKKRTYITPDKNNLK